MAATRLPRPWDSPGKNTGVGCHFLLQCMKVKSESEVAQSCPTLSDPKNCSPPGSSIHGIFQARVLEWGANLVIRIFWDWGFLGGSAIKNLLQLRSRRRCWFSPWFGKIPWKRKWLPTPIFLPREFHGQRSLASYSPWGCKELDTTGWLTHTHKHAHTHTHTQKKKYSKFLIPGAGIYSVTLYKNFFFFWYTIFIW